MTVHQSVEPELVAVQDAAIILGVSVRSIWRLRDSGAMPAPLKILGSVRWRRADLTEWVRQGCPDMRRNRRPN